MPGCLVIGGQFFDVTQSQLFQFRPGRVQFHLDRFELLRLASANPVEFLAYAFDLGMLIFQIVLILVERRAQSFQFVERLTEKLIQIAMFRTYRVEQVSNRLRVERRMGR